MMKWAIACSLNLAIAPTNPYLFLMFALTALFKTGANLAHRTLGLLS